MSGSRTRWKVRPGVGAHARRDDGDAGVSWSRAPSRCRPGARVLALIAQIGAFTALLAATMACVESESSGSSRTPRLAARLHDGGGRRGRERCGLLPSPDDGVFKAQLFLGAAPSSTPSAPTTSSAWAALARDAADRGLFIVATRPRRRVAACGVLLERGGAAPCGGRSARHLPDARAHRVPDRVLPCSGSVFITFFGRRARAR